MFIMLLIGVILGTITVSTGIPSNKTSSSVPVIEIQGDKHGKGGSPFACNACKPRYFYKKYQDPTLFSINIASATFTKIPGLAMAVHHSVPMVYKMRFQIGSQLVKNGAHSIIHFLINNQVLIKDQLYPNNEKRLHNQHVWDTSIIALDFTGGSIFYNHASPWTVIPYFKSEILVMPPGTHIIEVGARTEDPTLRLWSGQLIVELMEYDPELHIGLSYPSVA